MTYKSKDKEICSRQQIQCPPFSVQVLRRTNSNADASHPEEQLVLDPLLPASYRIEINRITQLSVPSLDFSTFIEHELNLQRLKSIFAKLWFAGRPIPPRPLHHQLLSSREIFITERMDMHLVWTGGRIFLKPIPRFLLEPSLWTSYLSCQRDCFCSTDSNSDARSSTNGCRQGLRACALGFLLSYASLISHESDFFIARDKHLLPREVEWLE